MVHRAGDAVNQLDPGEHGRRFLCLFGSRRNGERGERLAFLGEEPGERVSNVRAKELLATGAKTIGTACPFCNTMFRDATAAVAGDAETAVLDIAQLTARSLANVSTKTDETAMR